MAEQQELDLVEISPTANPPVVKIMDYKKFLFEQKKKQKEIKAKTAKVIVKEIRFVCVCLCGSVANMVFPCQAKTRKRDASTSGQNF